MLPFSAANALTPGILSLNRRSILLVLMALMTRGAWAQELFVYTEPASNMATNTIGLRLNNYLMREKASSFNNYHFVPEVMWGVSKKLMLHAEAFLGIRDHRFTMDGGGVYGKYRFYSNDEVHRHFRMAVYSRASINNTPIHQEAIDLYGYNSGFESGLIATQLIQKLAISGAASFLYALDNAGSNKFVSPASHRNALAWSFSTGKLLLPREYINYNQVNLNAMIEWLGQCNLGSGNAYLDLAPSLQFIFLSKMRLDIGYRFPVVNNLHRMADRGFLVRFEYNIFNAFK